MTRMFVAPNGKPFKTWNVWVGCNFGCNYCHAKVLATTRLKASPRYATQGFTPHLVESELDRQFKPDDYVFISFMGDISSAPLPVFRDIMLKCLRMKDTHFLLCTKNPQFYLDVLAAGDIIPPNVYLGATVETNRDLKLSGAPAPIERFHAMNKIRWHQKFLSIEPICDFDLDALCAWVVLMDPAIIEVGADNYGNHLREPPADKVLKLLEALRKMGPTVIEKKGLDRLTGIVPTP